VTLNVPADILRELTRDDAYARMTHLAPDVDIPAAEDAEQGYDQLEAEHLCMSLATTWAKQIPSGVYRRDATVAVS
jgi:hypothetical protein